MIRINLTRTRIQDTGMTSSSTVASTSSDGSGSSQMRDAIVKVAIIVIFTGGLMMWEGQNLRDLNETQGHLATQVQALTTENNNKTAEVEKVKDVEVQAKELEDKLKFLKLLSKLRLREVKTLDFMQTSIPEKVWLTKMIYDSDDAHIEGGHFQFLGSAVATEELTEFVKRLEDSAYLMDVIVIKNQEVTVPKGVPLRDFLFTAEVETKK